MLQFTTALDSESIDYEHPCYELGKPVWYKDFNGNWWPAKFAADNSPRGFGFTTIEYSFDFKPVVKSVPYCCLFDLDGYLAQQPEYELFEAATEEEESWQERTTRRIISRMGYGA